MLSHDAIRKPRTQRTALRWLGPALVLSFGAAAYWSSLTGAFVLDDHRGIINNVRIRQLWPPSAVLSGHRPVPDSTLALNYAIGGLEVRGYHIVNVVIHLLAALTLYGLVGRTLRQGSLRDRFAPASTYLATAVALLWVVHPLQTQSVTYLIQRCESLMGLFYLLTLYCLIRGVTSRTSHLWYAAGLTACALGMGSKAVMVTAPVAVLLYDRLCVSGSLRATLRARWGFYLGLVSTCGMLWLTKVATSVLSTSRARATVGFSFREITPLDYALTQFGVLTHYLRLSLWPRPLCLDYGWGVAESFDAIVPPAILLGCLAVGTVWACLRRPWLGYTGVWFFLILLPTSSVIPIRDLAFQHRMYLPLAAVTVALVSGAYALALQASARMNVGKSGRRFASGLVVVCSALALCAATIQRNHDYRTELAMWQDVVVKRPANHRGQYNLGRMLLDAGRLEEAASAFEAAVRLDPDSERALYNLGKTRSRQERSEEAMNWYLAALTLKPDMAQAHNDIGNILAGQNRIAEAILKYHEAIRHDPSYVRPYFNLGRVLWTVGRTDEAIEVLSEAKRISPDTARILFGLGQAFVKASRLEAATVEFRATLELQPDHKGALQALQAIRGRTDLP